MGNLVELVTPYHKRTSRDYLARMMDDKASCMEVSREYGREYWDGDRRFGYGGYRYDGRWKPLAEQIIARYGLTNQSSVLDVGCGKAHVLHELRQLLPDLQVYGFDPSSYGLADAPASVQMFLRLADAGNPLTWDYGDQSFDLVLAMGSLHNLKNWERDVALRQIARVGKQAYVWVESYRTALEQFNLQCWALTCWAFLTDEEWRWEFQQCGYQGDFEFIYFE